MVGIGGGGVLLVRWEGGGLGKNWRGLVRMGGFFCKVFGWGGLVIMGGGVGRNTGGFG